MQEAAFRAVGIKAFYLPFEVSREGFRRLMRGRRRLLLDGFNVTVPYKHDAYEYLKPALSPEARHIKAVNTVFQHRGRWKGANTDWCGFLTSLRKEGKFNPRNKKIVVLGAGSAARAAAYAFTQIKPSEFWILNRARFEDRRKRLVRDLKSLFKGVLLVDRSLNRRNLGEALQGADLIVNATSVGVTTERILIPPKLIPPARIGKRILFFDLVYHKRTSFLEHAKKKGHQTLDGLGMLVYQGAEAFRLWTGKKPPIAVMRKTLSESLRDH